MSKPNEYVIIRAGILIHKNVKTLKSYKMYLILVFITWKELLQNYIIFTIIENIFRNSFCVPHTIENRDQKLFFLIHFVIKMFTHLKTEELF